MVGQSGNYNAGNFKIESPSMHQHHHHHEHNHHNDNSKAMAANSKF